MADDPKIPKKLLDDIRAALVGRDAPFLRFINEDLDMEWLEESDSRLGITRFECDHHEIYRRKRLGLPPGKVSIGINPILKDDDALYLHTLSHELLHACLLYTSDAADE